MNGAANTGSVGSAFNGAEEGRDCGVSDEPSAAEWAAMQEEGALDAFVACEAERLAA